MPYAVSLQSYITNDVGRMNETVRLLKTDLALLSLWYRDHGIHLNINSVNQFC